MTTKRAAEGATEIRPGAIVRSTAGRDTGRVYAVIGLEGERFALVADGAARPVKRPKRKNLRHLEILRAEAAPLAEVLQEGRSPTDAQVRSALAEWAGPAGEREGGAETDGSQG
ncbi:MAG: KOW domain-containing RNA-binding protein [Firmicutes bacterium]|nr:KOW domain-containing RNA-binding protein [Bacillota bacterium]